MEYAEFFPGRTHQSGSTICRGWLSPHGRQLVLPYSLISVAPGQDRYSATPQLWRDAEGDCWLINYNHAQQEWIAENLGADLDDAKKRVENAHQAYAGSRTRAADRVLRSSEGKRLEVILADLEAVADSIQSRNLSEFGGDHLYFDVIFTDGSALRVLHQAGIARPGHGLIEVLVS